MRGRIEMWLHRSRVPRGRGRNPSMVGRTVWFSERVSHFGLIGWEGERSDNIIQDIHTHTHSHTHIYTFTLTHVHTLTLIIFIDFYVWNKFFDLLNYL